MPLWQIAGAANSLSGRSCLNRWAIFARRASQVTRPNGVAFVLALMLTAPATGWAADVSPDHASEMTLSMELFKGQVRGLLEQNCLKCHGGEKTKGEFDLT